MTRIIIKSNIINVEAILTEKRISPYVRSVLEFWQKERKKFISTAKNSEEFWVLKEVWKTNYKLSVIFEKL